MAERNIDEIWEGIMSDDLVQCGFALARLSPLAHGAVRASYANIECVVALIGSAHRASALDIAKRLALGHGLWLLNAGVLPAVAKVERPGCGLFLADLIDSSREARISC
jgi:hypothetical protein